jgi:radical SAM superfamily enzyme YgiQ (UPF0313 family)
MLFFPPQWNPAMPQLALPVLTAFLRAHGVEVIQRDLNIEAYDEILSRPYLEQTLQRLAGDYPRRGAVPDAIRQALAEGPALAAQVESAKAVFRSPAYYHGEESLPAFLVIAQALELASLPYYPAHFDLLNYHAAQPVDSSRPLLRAAGDAAHNIFLDIFRRKVIPDVARARPDIVGISIPTQGQVLAGVTLAHLIREAQIPCHITVGGPHITMLREQLPKVPALFDLFDSAVLFDGEVPLLRLAEALDSGSGLAAVPNLIWRDNGQMRVNPAVLQPVLHLSRDAGSTISLAAGDGSDESLPDFDGLPLDLYLAPDLVLPLIAAHGCYHGECAFCSVGYGAGKGFRPLSVEQVFGQIMALHRKYGVRHIFFADEAIPPRTMRGLSEALREAGSPVDWCGCARFESVLSEQLLESMVAGGCRMLLFGLETGSERMIQHMVKGTRRETMSRVLHEGARAGIWNHTFFFFGFPTETMEDAQETVNFIYEHQEVLHSGSPGVFVLERYSPAHADPVRFGITRFFERPDQDLAIYFAYEVESGLDEELSQTVYDRLLEVLPTKRYGQYYLHDVNRFLYASHLHAERRPFPPWLADEATEPMRRETG